MKWGKFQWFCSNCGGKQYSCVNAHIGRTVWLCSLECFRKFEIKTSKSVVGIDDLPENDEK
jgi:hypothetical protein